MSTFHSTLTVTLVIVALAGIVQSKPNVPTLTNLSWFLFGAAVAYVLSEAYALAEVVQPASFEDAGRVDDPVVAPTGPWLVIRSARS